MKASYLYVHVFKEIIQYFILFLESDFPLKSGQFSFDVAMPDCLIEIILYYEIW